jgi:outer membrane beta-barrel protein/carboxypeptidase-like protein
MRTFILIVMILMSIGLTAQNSNVSGYLFDKKGEPLLYATAVLLNPEDSTMEYYGISNQQGYFEMKNIKKGNYILQTSFIGFQNHESNVSIPLEKGSSLGSIVMEPVNFDLSEVEVNAMRVPFTIKKDTIEYNAGSYKIKPDAVAEELLEKLPGVQVDRAGNIKAQGENVQRVLVDGKEFFGSDPLVATKNLPADAIEKVQVYNKKSDETELTGIEDGTYSKTINMILKDGKKSAIFGDLKAGIGTDEKYQAGAKVYRFTKKHQFAALAMVNNINKYGFSFRDYMDFNGGLQSLMSGGSQLTISSDDDLPIDFGQGIDGLVTSGAAGANFTYEAKKDNRFNISYLGSGADKDLEQSTITNNFFDAGTSLKEDELDKKTTNRAHRINFGWRNKMDSTQNLILNGGLNYTTGTAKALLNSTSSVGSVPINKLVNITKDNADKYGGKLSASYLKKWNGKWRLLKFRGNIYMNHDEADNQWVNRTEFFNPVDSSSYNGYLTEKNDLLKYSASTSVTRQLGKRWFGVPYLSGGVTDDEINRIQGTPPSGENIIDSLSPVFTKNYQWMRGGISVKRNTRKSHLSFDAGFESSVLSSTLNENSSVVNNNLYFIPQFSWHYEYGTGRQLGIYYNSSVMSPTANQLLPIANSINPLAIHTGNINLIPEYQHSLQLNWIYFDQFSFTSIFASLNSTYTLDKINWSRIVNPDLSEVNTLINVDHDYRLDGSIDYSTPIRKLGLDFNARLNEAWNQGISMVNGEENVNTNFIHSLTISFSNRKNEKIDVNIGGSLNITDANYSRQESLNKVYYNTVAFTDIEYTPNDNWYFAITADLSRYDEESFGNSITIPLLRAEFTRYFLKNKRGVITLEIFDMLDKNKGVERITEMNYLMERQSNTIGRYAMLTFKYRLNKFDNKSGLEIDMNGR